MPRCTGPGSLPRARRALRLARIAVTGESRSMSDDKPAGDPDTISKITEAFESILRAVAERVRPAIDVLVQIAQDPAFQSAVAADRQPAPPFCHCQCEVVHRDEPCACDGESAGSVRVSDMDVPMCAPCQAARAAAKLATGGR